MRDNAHRLCAAGFGLSLDSITHQVGQHLHQQALWCNQLLERTHALESDARRGCPERIREAALHALHVHWC